MSADDSLPREQEINTGSLTLGAGATWWASMVPAQAANPIFPCSGQKRLAGSIFSSVAPGTIQVQLSKDGTNFDDVVTPTPDPALATSFTFDVDLDGQTFYRIVLTDAGAGSTVRIQASVFPEGSGATVAGAGPPAPPSPSLLPATYRVAADGTVFTPAGGTILQLRNPAASGRVLRVTLMLNPKPSVTMRWKAIKLSTITTGGTFMTPTVVPMDSNNAATVGIVTLYTDNVGIANGAQVGNVFDVSVSGGDLIADNPGSNTNLDQPLVLRAGQAVIWTSSVAVTFDSTIEWSDSAT